MDKSNRISMYFLFLFLIILDLNITAQNVKLKFINKTGKTIDSLFANRLYVGHLKNDSASSFVSCSSITLDSGSPIIYLSSIIEKNKVRSRKVMGIGMCGTELEVITSGTYTFNLKYYKSPVDTFIITRKIP